MLILIILFNGKLIAQNQFSAQLLTVTAHPFVKNNKSLHNRKIDAQGYLTFEPGLLLAYTQSFHPRIGVELSAGALKDRYDDIAAHLALMLKGNAVKYYKHSLTLGIGLAVFFEAGKMDTPNYVNEENFNTENPTMHKISLSGSIEYGYSLSKTTNFLVSLVHPHPRSFGITAGISINIYNPNQKGCNCPSFR